MLEWLLNIASRDRRRLRECEEQLADIAERVESVERRIVRKDARDNARLRRDGSGVGEASTGDNSSGGASRGGAAHVPALVELVPQSPDGDRSAMREALRRRVAEKLANQA